MIAAACHIHSNWSYDGTWSLEELAAEFARRDFRVLLMSEHDRGFNPERFSRYRDACAQASNDKVLLVPGIEYSDADNAVHVLVWGVATFLGEALPTLALLEAARAANGLAVLAHPTRRSAWKSYEPAWSEYLLGMEVWNRKTDGWAPSKTAGALMKHSTLVPFVGMDFHVAKQFFPLTMGLDITSGVNEGAVLECLRARRVRALAFGRPVAAAMGGLLGEALNSAERCRKHAAAGYRALLPSR
jgi:hypothetical protein